MRSSRIRIQDLTKIYHRARAVDGLTLDIAPGRMVALLGPSGCGKTTCLRMIAGLLQPTSGEILVDEVPITKVPVHRRNVGMLFQSYALFPHLTVAENVAFGLEMRGVRRGELKRRVGDALALVQLNEMARRLPAQLSGGQQQRVGLARALVVEPAMLLLDEPLGALDKSLREDMQMELCSLQRRLGLTTIMVTHDQEEALTMADLVVVMRDGRIEQAGTPAEVYSHPSNRFVAGFIGLSNVFEGVVEARGNTSFLTTAHGLTMTVPGKYASGSRMTAIIRPEMLTIGEACSQADMNEVTVQVEQMIYQGASSRYHLRTATGEPLIATIPNAGHGPISQALVVRWPINSVHLLQD